MKTTTMIATSLCLFLCACGDTQKGQEPTPVLDLLQVLPSSNTVTVGDTVQLGAQRVRGPEATNITSSVTWQSDNTAVVTVAYDEEKGAVATAVAPGTASISAQGEGASGTAVFVVQAAVASIELDTSVVEIALGTTRSLGSIAITLDGQKRSLAGGSWGSSDPALAEVDDSGAVSALAAGPVDITLVQDGFTTTHTIEVRDLELTQVTPAAQNGTALAVGQTTPLRVSGTFSSGTEQDLSALFSWTVDTGVDAAAEEEGPVITLMGATVTAVKPGAAAVTGVGKASSIVDGQTLQLNLTVVDPETLTTLVLVLPERTSIQRGDSPVQLTGTFNDVVVKSPKVSFSVEPTGIVYIDERKLTVTPLTAGMATVTASADPKGTPDDKADDVTVTAEIIVSDAAISALAIQPSETGAAASVSVDKALPLSAQATFGTELQEDATAPAVWTSDAPDIAAVSNVTSGRVVGRSPGVTTIRAAYLGTTASFDVTVTP